MSAYISSFRETAIAATPPLGTGEQLEEGILEDLSDEKPEEGELSTVPNAPLQSRSITPIPLQQKDLTSTKTQEESFLKTFGKYTLAAAGMSLIDATLTPKIMSLAADKLGFCLSNFLPKNGIHFLFSIESPIAKLNDKLGSLFGNTLAGGIMIPAICEEVQFRWFIQEVVFHTLPKKILEKIAPDLTYLVDSLPARISRVAAAAIIFSLIHAHALECSNGGGISQLIGGLLYGAMYECSDYTIVHNVNAHIFFNLFNKMLG